eukprot:5567592-Prorocentrum_lima.AAC.1
MDSLLKTFTPTSLRKIIQRTSCQVQKPTGSRRSGKLAPPEQHSLMPASTSTASCHPPISGARSA